MPAASVVAAASAVAALDDPGPEPDLSSVDSHQAVPDYCIVVDGIGREVLAAPDEALPAVPFARDGVLLAAGRVFAPDGALPAELFLAVDRPSEPDEPYPVAGASVAQGVAYPEEAPGQDMPFPGAASAQDVAYLAGAFGADNKLAVPIIVRETTRSITHTQTQA